MKLAIGGGQLAIAAICFFYGNYTYTTQEPFTNYAPDRLSLSSRMTLVVQTRSLPGAGFVNLLGLAGVASGGITLYLWAQEGEEDPALEAPQPTRGVAPVAPPPEPLPEPLPEPDPIPETPTFIQEAPPPKKSRTPPPQPKDEEAMRRSQYPYIFELLSENLLVFVGERGSGKSSKQAWLAAEHLKLGHRVTICNSFAKAGQYQGVELCGRGACFAEIEGIMFDFAAEAKRRITKQGNTQGYIPQRDEQHWHLACDEFSNYASNIHEEFLQELYEVAFQYLRQANMSLSIVTHGFQQAMLGGAEAFNGTFTSFKANCLKIYCKSKPHPTLQNERICAGFAIRSKTDMATEKDDNRRIKIPAWMQGPPNNDFSSLATEPEEVERLEELQDGIDLWQEFQQYRGD